MELDEYRSMAAAGARHWWYDATRSLLRELVEPHLPAIGVPVRFLDAAGGSGATGSWLAARGQTVVDDIELVALRSAMDDFSGYDGVLADIGRLPHPDACFDATLCVTALYHQLVADPQVVVDELVRVTKPGGLVVLMEPGVRRLRRGHDVVTHNARRFSRSDLVGLMERSGADVVKATGAYTFLIPPAFAMMLFERADPKSDVARNDSGLRGLLGTLARLERRAIRHLDLPFGLSVVVMGRTPF